MTRIVIISIYSSYRGAISADRIDDFYYSMLWSAFCCLLLIVSMIKNEQVAAVRAAGECGAEVPRDAP
jgi:hypothetical protein